MQIILSTEDVLRFILLGLKHETNLTPVEIHIGPINGEIKAVAGIGEEVPQGTFDDDDTDPVPEEQSKVAESSDTEVPAKKRRKRRTKEEIAADEAKAKEVADPVVAVAVEPELTKDPVPVIETKVQEAVADPAVESEPKDLFAETKEATLETKVVDPTPNTDLFAEPEEEVVTTAGANPFSDSKEEDHPEVSEDSLDLFSDPVKTGDASKPASETEDGFVKPAVDDKVLDLFN